MKSAHVLFYFKVFDNLKNLIRNFLKLFPFPLDFKHLKRNHTNTNLIHTWKMMLSVIYLSNNRNFELDQNV